MSRDNQNECSKGLVFAVADIGVLCRPCSGRMDSTQEAITLKVITL